MCASSEGNAEIQSHTCGHARSTFEWSWRDRIVDGETLLYFDKKKERHEAGVRFLLSRKATKSLLKWSSVSDRIITASFESRFKRVSIIMYRALTNTSKEEEKDIFYAQLQSVSNKIPNRNMLILIKDMNAKVGSDNTDREHEMGKHGLREMNKNGETLADLCSINSLVLEVQSFRTSDATKPSGFFLTNKQKTKLTTSW